MRNKNRHRLSFILAAVLLLAIAVFFTGVLENLRGARLDLTSDRLYTLSDSAEKILGRLSVPVQVKYYVTPREEMPTGLKNLERDITDKLRDYEDASGGLIQFSVHDPSQDEELQNALVAKGVRPFQVQSVERDEIGVKLVWSAITIAYKDKPEEILPQVEPRALSTFEYELISRIFRMTQEKMPVLALYAPKPVLDPQMAAMYLQMGQQPPEMPDTWASLEELLRGEHYDVRRIDLTPESPIPSDADALLVLGAKDLSPRQAWEIGNAVHRGVNTLIAVQHHEYQYQPGQRGGFRITARNSATGLEDLLRDWGLAVADLQFFDMEHETLSIPRRANIGGMRLQTSEPVRAPMQIAVRGDQMNRNVSITNRIEQIFYLWGTDVAVDAVKLAANDIGSRALFESSERSWHKPFSEAPLTQADVDPQGKTFEGPLPLAWLLDGQLAAPEGEMPAWEDRADSLPAAEPMIGGEAAPAQLLVTGCAKMFEEPFLGAGQNALLLLNSVDALALGGDLIGIRSRLVPSRSLRPAEAGEKLAIQFFAVGLVPLLIALFGIVRMVMRRKESALYAENFKARRGA